MHIHTCTHSNTLTHALAQIFWQTSLHSDSRTHQQIDGSQCVIGCEKRRGQLIHPIISLAVAIETDAYGNTAKRERKGGERGKKRSHEKLWEEHVFIFVLYKCVRVQETEGNGGGSDSSGSSSSSTTLMFNSVCTHILNECDRRWSISRRDVSALHVHSAAAGALGGGGG